MLQAKKMLNPAEALVLAAKQWSVTKGRSRRSEFWWPMLAAVVIGYFVDHTGMTFLLNLLMAPIGVRRLHDIGKSGWWLGTHYILNVGFGVLVATVAVIAGTDAVNLIIQFFGNSDADALFSSNVAKYGALLLVLIGYVALHFVYVLVLLYFFACDGEKDDNQYGASPKYTADSGKEDALHALEDKVM